MLDKRRDIPIERTWKTQVHFWIVKYQLNAKKEQVLVAYLKSL